MRSDAVVLEQLAATGWFVKHGEVAVTTGLVFCLEKDPPAAEAFTALIRDRTGLSPETIPPGLRWQAEWVYEKGGRVDIVGWLGEGATRAPVVVVEAKVSADFLPDQVPDYVVAQQPPWPSAASVPAHWQC